MKRIYSSFKSQPNRIMKNITLAFLLSSILSISLSFGQPGPRELLAEKPEVERPEAKPGGGSDLEKPTDRISKDAVRETLGALKEGKINRKEAAAKIKEIRDGLKEKGDLKEVKRPDRAELSEEVKNQLGELKEKQEALHAELKENIAELGDDATKAEIKEAAEAFKEANKEKFAEIKAAHEAIRDQIKENRPARPERPEIELSDELKAKVADLKEKRDELHEAKKALYDSLKEASTEEKQAIIAEFKENNKVKHKEIKDNAKALKEEIRGQVETEATRSSDL
jgi:DNA repair exonuclease SbcCD ATPase subunit